VTGPGVLWKVEGAGNDFVLGTGTWADRLTNDAALVVRLCSRRRGIGADGTLALHPHGEDRVRLVYHNRDGGRAVFCANGTRCAALAANRLLGMAADLTVVTDSADVPAFVRPDGVILDLMAPTAPPRDVQLTVHGETWRGCVLTIGVPHLIVITDDPAAVDLAAVAPDLRHHRDLGPEGANVSFVGHPEGGGLMVRTWERGVEAETLCCGSAILAAAFVELERSGCKEISCVPSSGDTLTVARNKTTGLTLTGPARLVAEVRPDPEWIRRT